MKGQIEMKKTEKKQLKEMMLQENYNDSLIRDLWGEVLDASELNCIIMDNASLEGVLKKVKESRCEENLTGNQIGERCMEIHKNIFKEISGNYEVNLCKHLFIDCDNMHEMEDIIIKIRMPQDVKPYYICLNVNQILEATVYLGGSYRKTYMVFRDENNNLTCVELLEFQLLSLTKDPENGEEYGFLVNYHWLTAKIQATTLTGWNLDILKNFILGEWFQMLINNIEVEDERVG